MIVMQLQGLPNGGSTPWDGQYLKDFDFEAFDGRGNIVTTPNVGEAKRFADMAEAMAFRNTVPTRFPRRADGMPNRPLTATNWSFNNVVG